MNRSLVLAVVYLILCAVQLLAADLTQIDRKITKEPAYKSKPKYCLLVFGPKAKTRVWIVLDGDTLYVDRNGNGDLTEAGEKVTAAKGDGADEGEYMFTLGDIHDGPLVHKAYVMDRKLDFLAGHDERAKPMLAKNPKARAYAVFVEMEMPGWKGTGLGGRVRQTAAYLDVNGILQFADWPQDAPFRRTVANHALRPTDAYRRPGEGCGPGRRHARRRSRHHGIH